MTLRDDVDSLQEKARKLTELQQEAQLSIDNLPVIREAIVSPETRLNAVPESARTEVSWEEVSKRVASEMGRASEAIQTRSNLSPAPSVDLTRAIQEDLRRVEYRAEEGFRAFSQEVTELRTWISNALSDTVHDAHKSQGTINERITETQTHLKGLKKAETYLHSKSSESGGASAPASVSGQHRQSPVVRARVASASSAAPSTASGPRAGHASPGTPPPTTLADTPARSTV